MAGKKSKMMMSTDADMAVERMHEKVMEGFKGGYIDRSNLVSWILIQFESRWFEGSIQEIRASHFDRLAYLENIVKDLKGAKASGSEVNFDQVFGELAQKTSHKRGRRRKIEGRAMIPPA